jgi:hypothetical protein
MPDILVERVVRLPRWKVLAKASGLIDERSEPVNNP